MGRLACSPWCVFKGSDSAPPEKAAFPEWATACDSGPLSSFLLASFYPEASSLCYVFLLRIGSDALLVAMTTDTSDLRKEELISAHSLRGQSAIAEKARWKKMGQ